MLTRQGLACKKHKEHLRHQVHGMLNGMSLASQRLGLRRWMRKVCKAIVRIFASLQLAWRLPFRDHRKGLYAIDVDELKDWRRANWGKLRVFENQSGKSRVCASLFLRQWQ